MEAEIKPGQGGSGGSGKPLPSIRLSGGASIALQAGGSRSIPFTVTRSLTTTAVTFSVGFLPEGVTAHFSPASLPVGSGTASVSLELVAASSAAAAHVEIRISATGTDVIPGALPLQLTLSSPFSQVIGAPNLPIGVAGVSTLSSDLLVGIVASGQAQTAFNIVLAAGVEGTVSFSIFNPILGISAQFQPSTLTASGAAGPMAVQIVFSAAASVTSSTTSTIVGVSVAGELRGLLTIPVRVGAFGSGSNYLFNNDCNPLTGVIVTIDITEDLVAAPPTADQQHGFAFQLNAYSPINTANPADASWTTWQQYIIGVGSGKIRGAVNNWIGTPSSDTLTISPALVLETLPQPDMIPAGYSLTIALSNDSQTNVNAVSFTVNPGTGNPSGTQQIVLTALTKTSGGPVTSADLAPIVAFGLNLVGPGDSKHANFLSGAGTITYRASNVLQPVYDFPACVAFKDGTGESSNSVYGFFSTAPNSVFSQSFSVQAPALVAVPQLISLTQAAVVGALTRAGLVPVEETTTVRSADKIAPHCIAQDPAAGTQVATGSTVIYTIATFVDVGSFPDK